MKVSIDSPSYRFPLGVTPALLLSIAELLDPLSSTAKDCHVTSLKIVRSGILPVSRVARGYGRGVGPNHSWVVVGDDCYAPDASIIDATLWSYDTTVNGIWLGTAGDGRHIPNGGGGSIWKWGRPAHQGGENIKLTPATPLSAKAREFLSLIEPLDMWGWGILADQAPVEGWPAAEIIAAMDDTKALSALVPIDRLGMLTRRNPGGLYLAGPAQDQEDEEDTK